MYHLNTTVEAKKRELKAQYLNKLVAFFKSENCKQTHVCDALFFLSLQVAEIVFVLSRTHFERNENDAFVRYTRHIRHDDQKRIESRYAKVKHLVEKARLIKM